MTIVNRVLSGVRALVWKTRTERELDEELRDYLTTTIEQKMASGMSRTDAMRAARIEMGSVEEIKDAVRDVGWETRVDSVLQDLRFAIRWFVQAPRFTIPALAALALGIGVTSAIFSVVRDVMLRPLPYRDPDRIVGVWETGRAAERSSGLRPNVIAPANYAEWRERSRSFEYLGMTGPSTLTIVVNGEGQKVRGSAFSADAFRAIGVQPMLGRAYTSAEDFDPDNAVIVLGYEFWQRQLGGRADVLGMAIDVNGQRRIVVGVMPRGFTVIGRKVDYLIPYGLTIEQLRAFRGRGNSYGIARLRNGVSLEQASVEMRALAAQLEKESPDRNSGRSALVIPIQEQMVGELRPAAVALVGAVLLVLLVACVNVANLLLARSAARERELGMRSALGAGRWRLVRQMLTESLVLAAAGGLAGVGVAVLFHRGLLTFVAGRISIPRLDEVALDRGVVVFTMVIALATGIVFGSAPALLSTGDATDALRDGGRHGGGPRPRRFLGTLVVVEVALSLVLLAGAGLLMRSFLKLQQVDAGIRVEGALTAQVQLPAGAYDAAKTTKFFRDALARVSALPGAQTAAAVGCLPLTGPCIGTSYWRVDRPAPTAGHAPSGHVRIVTPASFKALGIPQIAGRDFALSDTADSAPVAIVSESLAREHFPGENPVGRSVIIGLADTKDQIDNAWRIIGVVGDIKGVSLERESRPTIYIPHAQRPWGAMTLVVRTAQDPLSLANSVAHAIHALDPEVPVSDVRTLDDFVDSTIARPRAISVLVGAFALIALVLAAVGVYGVMAYSVLERTQEIGVRMALGATSASVFRLVLGHALRLVLIGVAAGVLAAAGLTRLLAGLLFQIEPFDPWTFAATAVTLLTVAAAASYIPACRVMHIAPMEALRTR